MKSVVVLLSTFNGEKYLEEQILSILAQTNVNLKIFVRDDGSTDNTQKILESYAQRNLITWYSGPNLKPARSFLDLLINAPDAGFYAFCDQDDYWMPDKLSAAIEKIDYQLKPALYCSDTILTDANLDIIRKGNIHAEGTFVESLISNPVTGCTMVINRALREMVNHYSPRVIDMHDWWIYRICMAIDGFFYFDTTPHIKYRQHENNVVGGVFSHRKIFIERIKRFLSKKIGIRYQMDMMLWDGYFSKMDPVHRDILQKFIEYKKNLKRKGALVRLICKSQINNKVKLKLFGSILINKY